MGISKKATFARETKRFGRILKDIVDKGVVQRIVKKLFEVSRKDSEISYCVGRTFAEVGTYILPERKMEIISQNPSRVARE